MSGECKSEDSDFDRPDEAFKGPGYIPIIDMSTYDYGAGPNAEGNRATSRAIAAACREAGFFVIIGHGVPQDHIDRAKSVSREFFSLSTEEKNRIAHMRKGYIPVGGCQNEVRSTSLHEKWSCGRVSGIDRSMDYYLHEMYFGDPNMWPAHPKEFEAAMTQYYHDMEQLTLRLLSILAVIMGEVSTFFEDKMNRHVTNLVALRYPPQDHEPEPGQMRAKPHTDPTVLTILAHDKPAGDLSGLEVLHDSHESWEPVHVARGGLVVNVGDLLHRWSGGNFRSAKHRVVNGRDDRLAISFFAMPNYDAIVAPLMPPPPGFSYTFEPIRAGDISHFTQLEREKQGLEDPQVLKGTV